MGNGVTRPVQFNIANHIRKCKEEAVQQQQWIDEGKLYYSKTVATFKERAAELREIAAIYEKMYAHFNANELCETETAPSEPQVEEIAVDVPEVVVEESALVTNNEIALPQIEDDKELSECTSIQLIEKLNEGKKADFRNKFNIKIARSLKYKIGLGIDNLEKSISGPEDSIPNLFSRLTVSWFKERCDWPTINRKMRLHYNLGSFNRSLDALILAYSASAYGDNELVMHDVYAFVKETKDWLYNEGENHVRGEPEPYASERSGLVSKAIVKYMDNGAKNLDPLIKLKGQSKVFYLATWLEDKIKPLIYNDSLELLEQNDPLALSYFHSIRNRVEANYSSAITSSSAREVQSMIDDGDTA